MKKTLLTLLVAVAASSAALAVESAASGRGPHRFFQKLASLGLTDSQKDQMRDRVKSHYAELSPLVHKLVSEREALCDVIHAEKIDEKAIRDQSAKVAAVEADLAVARAQLVADLRPILTPEQIGKLVQFRKDIEAKIEQFLERIDGQFQQ